jgi:hypothetical protein
MAKLGEPLVEGLLVMLMADYDCAVPPQPASHFVSEATVVTLEMLLRIVIVHRTREARLHLYQLIASLFVAVSEKPLHLHCKKACGTVLAESLRAGRDENLLLTALKGVNRRLELELCALCGVIGILMGLEPMKQHWHEAFGGAHLQAGRNPLDGERGFLPHPSRHCQSASV